MLKDLLRRLSPDDSGWGRMYQRTFVAYLTKAAPLWGSVGLPVCIAVKKQGDTEYQNLSVRHPAMLSGGSTTLLRGPYVYGDTTIVLALKACIEYVETAGSGEAATSVPKFDAHADKAPGSGSQSLQHAGESGTKDGSRKPRHDWEALQGKAVIKLGDPNADASGWSQQKWADFLGVPKTTLASSDLWGYLQAIADGEKVRAAGIDPGTLGNRTNRRNRSG
ncbi:hypothetical protein [Rosistilla oblonga]|uniref:hypothetical protein n=1 Tax=Rosistilla oblonga TaxID=2527990 RepID=UPI0011A8B67A|nr:hypothetical protein [Rosistilla oblonga]